MTRAESRKQTAVNPLRGYRWDAMAGRPPISPAIFEATGVLLGFARFGQWPLRACVRAAR